MTLPDAQRQPSAIPGDPPRLYYADGSDAPADIITDGLRLLAGGQGADRVSLRCIRYRTHADGTPRLDDRGEHRREVMAGTFDDFRRAGDQAAEINARGAHVYAHVQRSGAPITNRLLPGNIATVSTHGIAAYTTLFVDIDPEPGAEPGAALVTAAELVEVLIDTAGVPAAAIQLEQSGRGAYVLIAIEPQPISIKPTMRLALSTIKRVVDAACEPTHVDDGVYDPPRIKRVPGTRNWKSDANPATPAWILRNWTPGIRTPWSIVERLASKSRPKLRAVPSGSAISKRDVGNRRPLRDIFRDHGWLYRERADGIADVKCPNYRQHTDGREGAILYPPREPGGPGWLKCSHQHCADLDLFTVFKLLEGRA